MPPLWIRFGDHRDYPIHIQPGILQQLGRLAAERVAGRNACLITHPRLFRLYGAKAAASLRAAGFRVGTITVPQGENSKSLAMAETCITRMIRQRLDRRSVVVALGGGVIGDLAGLVAALYMRGIPFIQVPTTLLAQVDSSVGGKVAVNHPLGKNLIGAFLQPRLVVTDPEVLASLPEREFRSGLAEVIKSAAIADADFFGWLEKNLPKILRQEPKALAEAIRRSCAIKGRVVEADETEQGLRAILNYGHTVGHALETYHHYSRYLHGEAVAIGMAAAAHLALELGLCPPGVVDRQEALLSQAGLPIRGNREAVGKILTFMKTDKKSLAGDMNFVLTPIIGDARICKKILPFSVRRVLMTVLERC